MLDSPTNGYAFRCLQLSLCFVQMFTTYALRSSYCIVAHWQFECIKGWVLVYFYLINVSSVLNQCCSRYPDLFAIHWLHSSSVWNEFFVNYSFCCSFSTSVTGHHTLFRITVFFLAAYWNRFSVLITFFYCDIFNRFFR